MPDKTVELETAFMWACPDCGAQNWLAGVPVERASTARVGLIRRSPPVTEIEKIRKEKPREFDAKVATMMGWRNVHVDTYTDAPRNLCGTIPGTGYVHTIPHFTSDANADYSVLEHVRKTWSWEKQSDFKMALNRIWNTREDGVMVAGPILYETGDYSQALAEVTPHCASGADRK